MFAHFPERPGSLVAPQRGGRRKIRVSADILTGSGSGGDTAADGEDSSCESRLSDTDMMSPDDDPDLDALLSPDLDTPDEMEDSIMERKLFKECWKRRFLNYFWCAFLSNANVLQ